MSEEQAALRDVTEWWDRLPSTLRQDIEGSGNVPGCIARARRLLAAPASGALLTEVRSAILAVLHHWVPDSAEQSKVLRKYLDAAPAGGDAPSGPQLEAVRALLARQIAFRVDREGKIWIIIDRPAPAKAGEPSDVLREARQLINEIGSPGISGGLAKQTLLKLLDKLDGALARASLATEDRQAPAAPASGAEWRAALMDCIGWLAVCVDPAGEPLDESDANAIKIVIANGKAALASPAPPGWEEARCIRNGADTINSQ